MKKLRTLKNINFNNLEEINKPKKIFDNYIEDYVCENCNACIDKNDKKCWHCLKKFRKDIN